MEKKGEKMKFLLFLGEKYDFRIRGEAKISIISIIYTPATMSIIRVIDSIEASSH